MKKALILAGIYLLFGILWIIFTDLILFEFVDVTENIHTIQSIKGIVFVILSALLIFLVSKALNRTIDRQKIELEHTTEELNLILDNTEELIGLTEVKENGEFIYIRGNRSFYNALKSNQIEVDDFVNRELKEHHKILAKKGLTTPGPELMQEQYEKVVTTKAPLKVDFEFETANYGKRTVEIRLSPILNNQNHVTHVLFVSEDVTEKIKRKRENTYSNIQVLSTQLNPHFIFNALSSIQFFILDRKTETAINYLSSFSGLMRKTLNNSMKRFISLDKEIEFLEEYINLEIQRKEQDVGYKIKTSFEDVSTEDIALPPMLLQPFIENAFLHGFPHNGYKKYLKVFFMIENNKLVCLIDDNGIGRKKAKENKPAKEEHRSHGMRLINERLRLLNELFNDAFEISIIDKEDLEDKESGTRVEIRMPVFYSDDIIN